MSSEIFDYGCVVFENLGTPRPRGKNLSPLSPNESWQVYGDVEELTLCSRV